MNFKFITTIFLKISAGVGRTGTFCVIHSIIKGLRDGKCMWEDRLVPTLIGNFRSQRHSNMVETPAQLLFIYDYLEYKGILSNI